MPPLILYVCFIKPHTGARGKHTTADGGDTTCHEPLVYEFRPQYNWISTGGAGKKVCVLQHLVFNSSGDIIFIAHLQPNNHHENMSGYCLPP